MLERFARSSTRPNAVTHSGRSGERDLERLRPWRWITRSLGPKSLTITGDDVAESIDYCENRVGRFLLFDWFEVSLGFISTLIMIINTFAKRIKNQWCLLGNRCQGKNTDWRSRATRSLLAQLIIKAITSHEKVLWHSRKRKEFETLSLSPNMIARPLLTRMSGKCRHYQFRLFYWTKMIKPTTRLATSVSLFLLVNSSIQYSCPGHR